MKIKVGDWVKVEQKVGKVVHVYSPSSEWVAVKLDGVGIIDVRINTVTKLPIKFKEFEIEKDFIYVIRVIKGHKTTGKFVTNKIDGVYHAASYAHIKNEELSAMKRKDFPTIEEARDWLELQYTTLIAKARGLI